MKLIINMPSAEFKGKRIDLRNFLATLSEVAVEDIIVNGTGIATTFNIELPDKAGERILTIFNDSPQEFDIYQIHLLELLFSEEHEALLRINSDIPKIETNAKFDVFISYSRKNPQIMNLIYTLLTNRGLNVWVDKGLGTGTDWRTKIEEAIENSNCIASILSPPAKKSPAILGELKYAETLGIRIFPIVIEGSENDSIPLDFRYLNYVSIADAKEDIQQLIIAKYVDEIVNYVHIFKKQVKDFNKRRSIELEVEGEEKPFQIPQPYRPSNMQGEEGGK